jgi:hypothetical protein
MRKLGSETQLNEVRFSENHFLWIFLTCAPHVKESKSRNFAFKKKKKTFEKLSARQSNSSKLSLLTCALMPLAILPFLLLTF